MTLAILVNLLEKQRERETQWRKPCGWRGPSIVLSKTSGESSRCHFYTVALQEWLGSLLLEWWREEPVAPAAGCVPRNSSSRHSPGLWPLSFAPSPRVLRPSWDSLAGGKKRPRPALHGVACPGGLLTQAAACHCLAGSLSTSLREKLPWLVKVCYGGMSQDPVRESREPECDWFSQRPSQCLKRWSSC